MTETTTMWVHETTPTIDQQALAQRLAWSSLRLRRLAQQCAQGQLAAAEIELHEWQRQDDCPTAAVELLAALLARRGATEHALTLLHKHSERRDAESEPGLTQLLVAILTATELTDAARQHVRQLYRHFGHQWRIMQWLYLMHSPGCQELPSVSESSVEHLAAELLEQPQVIPSLVAAQKVQPQATALTLLRRAITLVSRDIGEPRDTVVLCQALADLALLARDTDDARRWAHRGLKIDPYCAALALVLARVSDDVHVGPPASAVLNDVAAHHPDYPDVQAALIRREHADGRILQAREHLRAWLQRRPQERLARQLAQELAA